MPLVSVITPLYNMETFVGDTIRSAQNQTFTDYEHLIVNDASTDTSTAVVKKCMSQDPRIRLLEMPSRSGPHCAVNTGIEHSAGDYIALLAADDLLTKDSLLVRVNNIANHTLICGQCIDIPEKTTLENAYQLTLKPDHITQYFYGPTNLIRKSVFQKYGLFDEELPIAAEREFWVRLFGLDRERTDRGTFRCLPDLLGYFRVRSNSIQHQVHKMPRTIRNHNRALLLEAIERNRMSVDPQHTRFLSGFYHETF